MVKKLASTAELRYGEAYQKVLFWFFAYPDKQFSLTDIVTAVQISKTTANKVIG